MAADNQGLICMVLAGISFMLAMNAFCTWNAMEVVHFLARVRGISVWNSCILDMPQTLSSNGKRTPNNEQQGHVPQSSRNFVLVQDYFSQCQTGP
ncbi:hypothetical protein ACLKA6_019973 [Drosophila palustris]